MKAMVKRLLGWHQRTETEKAALRRLLFALHGPLRALGSCLISLLPSPPWFKRYLASLYVEKARMDIGSGASAAALQAAKHAVTLCPELTAGFWVLTDIMLPGEGYRALLQRFHDWLQPKSYIEIGVNVGASIALAKPPTVVIGIDPQARLIDAPKTVCKIFPPYERRLLSQTRSASRYGERNCGPGVYRWNASLFEQALRDFINIERVSSPTTIVLIHDTFPIDALTAERLGNIGGIEFWTGDVWKIIPCLREFRPDLYVFTIATPPTGLSVVSKLNSRSRVLTDRFDEIVSRYISLKLDPDEGRRKECAVMIANNWSEIKTRLSNAN
jgi:hypothetical protein